MAKRDPMLDHLILFIGDKAIPLSSMNGADKLPLNQGLQMIIDDGLLGQEYVGMKWFDVIKPSSLGLEGRPDPEEVLLVNLYDAWYAATRECMVAQSKGLLTEEQTQSMLQLKRDYDMAKKLTRE